MSIYYSGTFTRSGGVVSAIGKQLKLLNLKAVSRIIVKFDPFKENTISARELLFHLSTPKISGTNPKCVLRTEILCGRQPSEISFLLNDPAQKQAQLKEIKLLPENLSTLELLQICNKHISTLAPQEEIATTKTKLEKKQVGTKKGSKKK
ncbi:uncharacterized protein LOC129606510 [Condylostylus longicornis]|uniref:uncharacterized protein LOC129606510 n=1 Tax=Condylostylus longicornis TaxID=2530218 RepID=UPI00244DD8A1|nr:uncharacterized protein LOC129606510 [Condylostylus longicornis]